MKFLIKYCLKIEKRRSLMEDFQAWREDMKSVYEKSIERRLALRLSSFLNLMIMAHQSNRSRL